MELSPPLRWLGALAIMLVVVLIVVPMLLQTVSDTVELGGQPSEDTSEFAALASEPASEPAGDEGGGGGGGGGQNADDEFPQDYTVQAGDTGTKISERFYDSSDGWSAIAEANDIDPSAPLRVGVKLEIPAPE